MLRAYIKFGTPLEFGNIGAVDFMPFRVIEIQETPNPNALKFVVDRQIASQPTSFFDAAAAKDHALAGKLFEITGVSSLLLLGDFVTVNKDTRTKWSDIKSNVQKILESAE